MNSRVDRHISVSIETARELENLTHFTGQPGTQVIARAIHGLHDELIGQNDCNSVDHVYCGLCGQHVNIDFWRTHRADCEKLHRPHQQRQP